MTTDCLNRKLARHAIGTGLRAVLVGNGLPCNAFYDEPTDAWQQQAPVTMIVTSGSNRGSRYLGTGKLKTAFAFEVVTVVPDSDSSATPPYTSAMSEDTLDDIEKIVSDWISDNQNGTYWKDLHRVDAMSRIDSVPIAKPYKEERIAVECNLVIDT